LELSALGFGAFKIGRNEGIKYARPYALPSDDEVDRLLRGVVNLGINYIDTAPAYGLSEERIGRVLGSLVEECVVSTKVGETFEGGVSRYDFSETAVRESIARSRRRLRREHLDLVFIHSNGDDLRILRETDVVPTLRDLKSRGDVRAIGFSGKTVEGATAALDWADAIMVQYHLEDESHASVIGQAHHRGVGVVVKKGLAAGRLPPAKAIQFALANPGVTSLVVGGLSFDHLRANAQAADAL
jgi:aryl-alcohol dehydrogenase-like predicted oxidoreductase